MYYLVRMAGIHKNRDLAMSSRLNIMDRRYFKTRDCHIDVWLIKDKTTDRVGL
jgi:hypothetical protein